MAEGLNVPGAPKHGVEGLSVPATAATPSNAVTYNSVPVTYQGAAVTH